MHIILLTSTALLYNAIPFLPLKGTIFILYYHSIQLHALNAEEKEAMLSKVWLLVQDLLVWLHPA